MVGASSEGMPYVLPGLAATPCAIAGQWDLVDTDSAGANYGGPVAIAPAAAPGTFRWTWVSGWSGTGTVAGSTVTLDGRGSGYTARWNGTVDSGCSRITGRWTQNNGQTGTFTITRRTSAAAQPLPPGCVGHPAVLLWSSGNTSGVANGPGGRPAFQVSATACITQIVTYHWNNGRGAAPGTIGLQRAPSTGPLLGPFRAQGTPGQNNVANANWVVTLNPPLVLGPDDYAVVDSDDATWSRNAASAYRGFAQIYGVCADRPGNGCVRGGAGAPALAPTAPASPAAGATPPSSGAAAPAFGPAPNPSPCNLRNGFQFECYGAVIAVSPRPVTLGNAVTLTVNPRSGYGFNPKTVIVLEPSSGVGAGVGLRTLCGGLNGGKANRPCPAASPKSMTLPVPNDGSLPAGTYLLRAENWNPAVVANGQGVCNPACTEADAGYVEFVRPGTPGAGTLQITGVRYPGPNGQIVVTFADPNRNVTQVSVRPWTGYQWGPGTSWNPGVGGAASGQIYINAGCQPGRSYSIFITLADASGQSATRKFDYTCR